MSDFLKTAIIIGGILLTSIAICEVIGLIHKLRIRVNTDRVKQLEQALARKTAENTSLWSRVTDATIRETVHTKTIAHLTTENEALEAENRMLMDGTPIIKPLRIKRIVHM